MNDMRMAKYETLIEDIDSNNKKSVGLFGGYLELQELLWQQQVVVLQVIRHWH